jgi:hypothetical protein
MKRILRIILGVILITYGLVALVTPFTPGSWLAVIGLELLGIRMLVQRRLLSLLPPRAREKVRAALDRLCENRWFRKLRPRPQADAKAQDRPDQRLDEHGPA